MKHNPQGITTAMQLYFSGESLRNTARSIRLIGMNVTHQTVYNWIGKYTGLMTKYSEQITPNIMTLGRLTNYSLKSKAI
jgi:transposase-like protein